jgi:hypothetical protein
MRAEVEGALAAHFGRPVPLDLVVEGADPAPADDAAPAAAPVIEVPVDEPSSAEVHELDDAPADDRTVTDRLAEAFPGAELLEGQ